MNPIVVNVSTGAHYVKGQARLARHFEALGVDRQLWCDCLPPGSPSHADRPYAFKAYALQAAAALGYTKLLWADACIIPIGPLDRIWANAAEHGAWISNNGYSNYEWTADSAYPDLFPAHHAAFGEGSLAKSREINRTIPHVVATAFALDLEHPKGRAFLDDYFWLASETNAFCGPWTNGADEGTGRKAPCGPPDIRGHRHDQTAASVLAWRLDIPLTNPPDFFAYKGGETAETVLIADGNY